MRSYIIFFWILFTKYYSVAKTRCARHVARIQKVRNLCKILGGQPTSKRPPRRPDRKWTGNTEIGPKEEWIEDENHSVKTGAWGAVL
jgi:hypothetical protein